MLLSARNKGTLWDYSEDQCQRSVPVEPAGACTDERHLACEPLRAERSEPRHGMPTPPLHPTSKIWETGSAREELDVELVPEMDTEDQPKMLLAANGPVVRKARPRRDHV